MSTLGRLLGNTAYFVDRLNLNKYYYFYVGYKDDKKVRTWDHWMTLAHFASAIAFGILIYEPLS